MKTLVFVLLITLLHSARGADLPQVDYKLCDWDSTILFAPFHQPIRLANNKDGFEFTSDQWKSGAIRSDIKNDNNVVIGTELKFEPSSSPSHITFVIRFFKGRNSRGLTGVSQVLAYFGRWEGRSYIFNYETKMNGDLRCIPVHGEHIIVPEGRKSAPVTKPIFDMRPCNRLRALYAKVPMLEKCGYEVRSKANQRELSQLKYEALKEVPIMYNWWGELTEDYKMLQENIHFKAMCLSGQWANAVQRAVGPGFGDNKLDFDEPSMPLTTQAGRFLEFSCRSARYGTAVDETYQVEFPKGPWVPGRVF